MCNTVSTGNSIGMKITQTIEIDLEKALVDAIKSLSEERFALLISSVIKRAHNPLANKILLLKELESIH